MLLVVLPLARFLSFFYHRPAQMLCENEITLWSCILLLSVRLSLSNGSLRWRSANACDRFS